MLALQLGRSLSPLTYKAGGQNLDLAEVKVLFTTSLAMVKQTSESTPESLKKVSWLSNAPRTYIS